MINVWGFFQVQVAIKCLSKERMQNGTQEFLKEAGIMQTIDHENITRMFGVVIDKDNSLMLVSSINFILHYSMVKHGGDFCVHSGAYCCSL